jgi:hypothetical protein
MIVDNIKPTRYGWGVKDVNYAVRKYLELPRVNGKQSHKLIWSCPYHIIWQNMLKRCFSIKVQEVQTTYVGCTIHEDWKYLSNFIKWVDSQPNRDWQNCQLDKDLLFSGNKIYSPETCVFIPQKLNGFILDSYRSRGLLMLGVSSSKRVKKPFTAQCKNPFSDESSYIGMYTTELEAHKAWQAKKHEYACQLADLQDDPRVAEALRQRYSPDKDWTKS